MLLKCDGHIMIAEKGSLAYRSSYQAMNKDDKLKALRSHLEKLPSVAVAYSGGVDSSFLLLIAHQVLGDKAIAVTNITSTYSKCEESSGKETARSIGADLFEVCSNELADPDFIDNPIDRCYYCKRDLFTEIIKLAKKKGIEHVVDGENADDMLADRPGHKAAIEMNIKSPLAEVGLTKDEIRSLSRQLGLRTAGKQQMACLSSRIPFNEEITVDKLRMVEKAEELIRSLGIKELRVRASWAGRTNRGETR